MLHGPRYLERIVEGANPLSVQVSKYIEHKVYKRTQHIIALSEYMKSVLIQTYGFPEQRISVIPGGAIPGVLAPLSQSLLLEGTSPQHITDGIQEALSGRRILPSMQTCEAYSAANHAWPMIARKVHGVYRDVLNHER